MIRHALGQHMFIGLEGPSLSKDEKDFIVSNNVGGVVLFGRNVKEPKQVHELCREIQSLRHQMPDKAPLFIGIDMEGGRVARLKAPFTVWPPLKKVGDLDNPTLSFHFSYCLGRELRAVGINLDFAPCLDVNNNPQNTVIGDRAVSADVNMVSKHASALVRGFIKSDVISCAKHFPGHGHTLIDSHEDLPVEDLEFARLDQVELQPFKKAFRARAEMVMMAHILFPKIDPDFPASLSEIFIKKVLRSDCRYRGLVISDDLGMGALTRRFSTEEIAVRSLQAGIDLLLYCNDPKAPPVALEALVDACANGPLNAQDVEVNYRKILQFKLEKIKNPDPLPLDEALKLVGNDHHQKVARALADGHIPEGLLVENKGE
ncbi:MAG: beta-N-acetylhexosaminidase [Bdellovibrionales bacterium]